MQTVQPPTETTSDEAVIDLTDADDVVIDLTEVSEESDEHMPGQGSDEEEGDEGFVIRGPLDDANLDLEELSRIEAEMIEVDAALKALDEGLDSLRARTAGAAPDGPLAAIAPLLHDIATSAEVAKA